MKEQESTYMFDVHDEQELVRLQMQESVWNEIMALIPPQCSLEPDEPASILDLGCGPGGWALQVAQAYPACSVIGMDISAPMIKYARAQAELRELSAQFRIADMRQLPWHFPDDYFDFVNTRFIGGVIPVAFWDAIVQEWWRVLKPGGVIRYTDSVSVSTPVSPNTQKFSTLVYRALYQAGLAFNPYDLGGAIIGQKLKRKGFENLTLTPYAVDISPDAPLYKSVHEDLLIATKTLRPFIVRSSLCTPEEFSELEGVWEAEWASPDFCGYWCICSFSATKPRW